MYSTNYQSGIRTNGCPGSLQKALSVPMQSSHALAQRWKFILGIPGWKNQMVSRCYSDEYLEKVWEAVAREALTVIFHDVDTSGFEEDARLTAMWLWTLSAGGRS